MNSYTTNVQGGRPRIAVAPDGDFIVAWTSSLQEGPGTGTDVYAQRFEATGVPRGLCPAAPLTREQMGVFIGATFGLTLYGP